MQQEEHMRTGVILVFTFIKSALKMKKVKSTASASKKIKTIHHIALNQAFFNITWEGGRGQVLPDVEFFP